MKAGSDTYHLTRRSTRAALPNAPDNSVDIFSVSQQTLLNQYRHWCLISVHSPGDGVRARLSGHLVRGTASVIFRPPCSLHSALTSTFSLLSSLFFLFFFRCDKII